MLINVASHALPTMQEFAKASLILASLIPTFGNAMAFRGTDLQRFFYSHYFFSGVRQTIGVLTPALVLGGLFHFFYIGAVASMGAACVAILDQPGGPRRYGTNGMLGAMLLGSLTAAVTGLASSNTVILWMTIPLLCFVFSMFTVFGKQGGLLGFACLLLMTLTMRTPMTGHEALLHTGYSFLGGLFYFSFSYGIHRMLWHREGLQALSVALFATADYIKVRSTFYDMDVDLDDSYRTLIHRQADMTEKHQAARDLLLRELPRGKATDDHLRIASINAFVDMVALLDSMIATQTDYATLRRRIPDSDILLFSRDALYKMSRNVERIALDTARNQQTKRRTSVKAELRAFEYELEKYKRAGLSSNEPEVYALLVQILRRLRNATRIIDRMSQHAQPETDVPLLDERLDKSLARFLSRQDFRLSLLTSNLRLDSPHFRYAVRVATAAFLAMTFSFLIGHSSLIQSWIPGFTSHSYWIVLTVLVIMKPGYALTRQRNHRRLTGTLIGCGLALILFNVTDNLDVYIVALIITSVLGYSLIQLSYLISAVFNTVFVLLVFQFLAAGGTSAIGERLFDTLIASLFALLCSYILPWWEHNFMASLADAARRANRDFFNACLNYAALSRELHARRSTQSGAQSETVELTQTAPDAMSEGPRPVSDARHASVVSTAQTDAKTETLATLAKKQHEADMRWRLARQQAYTAFSNFASAFYRMMDEPVRQQVNVPELNHLLIQNHVLASQITAATPVLASLEHVPPGIQGSLDAIGHYLNDQDATPPISIETEGELATLAYPIRQMVRAAQLIRQEMRGVEQPGPVQRQPAAVAA